jgi:hypothetical protein
LIKLLHVRDVSYLITYFQYTYIALHKNNLLLLSIVYRIYNLI